jgi:hypothetical protein
METNSTSLGHPLRSLLILLMLCFFASFAPTLRSLRLAFAPESE